MFAPRLILASGSPRRKSLLREAGYVFVVAPADIDEETYPPNLLPAAIAEFLAVAKAELIANRFPHDVTLAADTVVALGDQQLGKPRDAEHAREMLTMLCGTTHQAITGVCVMRPATRWRKSVIVTSTVQMRILTATEIDQYVAGGQWEGKAGSYGIQDDDPFVTRIAGSTSNIVGLPIEATAELLTAAGIHPVV